MVNLSKKNYFRNKLIHSYRDSKKSWEIMNEVIHDSPIRTKVNNLPKEIIINDMVISDKNLMVERFNDFFVNITQTLNICSNMGNVDNTTTADGSNCHDAHLYNSQSDTNFNYDNYNVTSIEIENIVAEIPNKFSTGPDAISSYLIKSIITCISQPLASMANTMLKTGIFPSLCKKAKVIVIFKKGSKDSMNNYRPISLLNFCSKIFEKIIHNRLIKFINENNIIMDNQYGFRANSNTNLAILDFTEFVRYHVDCGQIVAGIFLDIAKAFDCVDHSVLISKLNKIGICNNALKLFANYLSNRSQYIQVDGFTSTSLNIKAGVPQGSVLGPTLFLIYINNIFKISINAKIISFADDTSVLFRANNVTQLYNDINENISLIFNWFSLNKLSINADKTRLILFTSAHKEKTIDKIITNSDLKIVINDIQIARCKTIQYLGIYIDSNLSYKSHIEFLIGKISKQIGIIGKLRHYIPIHLLILYYYAHVQSHIQYGIEIYGLTAKTHLLPLDSIINKSVQVMTFMNYVDHVSPTRVKLGIPNFKVLFYRSIADKMFRIINKVGHVHNSFEFGTTTGTRSLRSNVDCVRLKHKKNKNKLR